MADELTYTYLLDGTKLRVYCIDTPDGELWECWDVKDYLGNVRAVVRSNNGSTIKINDYLPYGTKIEEYSSPYQVGHNR